MLYGRPWRGADATGGARLRDCDGAAAGVARVHRVRTVLPRLDGMLLLLRR